MLDPGVGQCLIGSEFDLVTVWSKGGFAGSRISTMFGPERDYFVELEVDSSHVLSLLQGRVHGGVLEQTDSKEILWNSMRFYAHAPGWLQKILNVQSYSVILQLFLEGFNLLRCIQWAKAFSFIWELTHFHHLHKYVVLQRSVKRRVYQFFLF